VKGGSMAGGIRGIPERRGGHESRDLGIRGILIFGGALVVVAAAIQVGLFLVLRGMVERRDRGEEPRSIFEGPRQPEIPAPRLMTREGQGLAELRAEEERVLATYGWIDRKEGVVRIPVERAMELILERGLPSRGGTRAGVPEGAR
jgi:hypothetical protein